MDRHSHPFWQDWFQKKDPKRITMIDVLRESALFKKLDSRELLYLSSMIYERHYEPGEIIFRQGDPGFGMYIIANGSVGIQNDQSNENEYLVRLDAGNFFGEIALVNPEDTRSAQATAIAESTLYGFFKSDLMEIIDRKPAMGAKILLQLSYVIGQRLIETTELYSQSIRQKQGLGG